MNIGDLFFRALLDGSELQKQAKKEGEKAGQTLGQSASASMKTVLKVGIAGVAAGAAGAFAIATRGVLELERLVADFRAETGATAEEAKRAGDAILEMSSRNIQPMEAIGRALTKVHTDLGLTGAEAERITETFLKFARATGQDAAQAVVDFDDILDAWGLTAGDALKIMDSLIVSHQKYGGVIAESERILGELAPTLQAANLGWEDGIALLNLFNAAGVDAAAIPRAMQAALAKVKSPAQLKALIADIANTPDDFARATKAADVFGTRAGAKLGRALKGANLDDYKLSVEELTGATVEAADILDSTFGAQMSLKIKAVGAAIVGFGSDFGPAVTGASSLLLALSTLGGGKLIRAILGPFGKLGARLVTAVGAAILQAIVPSQAIAGIMGTSLGTTAGSTMGVAMAAAIPAALAAAAVAAVGIVFLHVQGEIERQSKELVDKTTAFAKAATLDALQQARKGVAEQLAAMPSDPVAEALGLSAKPAIEKTLRELDAAIAVRLAESARGQEKNGAEIGLAIGAGIARGTKQSLHVAATELDSAVNNSIRGPAARAASLLTVAFRRAGAESALALAGSIRDKKQAVTDAFDQLLDDLKHPQNRMKEQARIVGILTSKQLAKGLKSGDSTIRKQAEATMQIAIARLQELAMGTGKLGKKAQDELEKGLRSKNPKIKLAAEAARDAIANGVKPTGQEQTGITVVDDLTRGIENAAARARLAKSSGELRDIVKRALAGLAPSTPGGGGGPRTRGGRPRMEALGGTVPGNVPTWTGELGVPELIVPRVTSRVTTLDQLGSLVAQPRGGDQYHITTPAIPIRDKDSLTDLASGLRRLARTGNLTRRPMRDVAVVRA